MSLKHNYVDTKTFQSIIENYLAYFHIVKKDYLSANKPIIIPKIDIKVSLDAFTSKDCIISIMDTLGVDFDSNCMVVTIENENCEENPINAYKQFCHDFLTLYISKHHNEFSCTDYPVLISHVTNRILKFSLNNMRKDFIFYVNTLKFTDTFKNLSFKNIETQT